MYLLYVYINKEEEVLDLEKEEVLFGVNFYIYIGFIGSFFYIYMIVYI